MKVFRPCGDGVAGPDVFVTAPGDPFSFFGVLQGPEEPFPEIGQVGCEGQAMLAGLEQALVFRAFRTEEQPPAGHHLVKARPDDVEGGRRRKENLTVTDGPGVGFAMKGAARVPFPTVDLQRAKLRALQHLPNGKAEICECAVQVAGKAEINFL